MRYESIDDNQCRIFTTAVELVGKRWSSSILLAIARGAHRFSEIIASVDDLSDRMLAQRLRELEHTGLIIREVVPTAPVQIRYELSERGRDLMRSLQPLVTWAHKWEGVGADARPTASAEVTSISS